MYTHISNIIYTHNITCPYIMHMHSLSRHTHWYNHMYTCITHLHLHALSMHTCTVTTVHTLMCMSKHTTTHLSMLELTGITLSQPLILGPQTPGG